MYVGGRKKVVRERGKAMNKGEGEGEGAHQVICVILDFV